MTVYVLVEVSPNGHDVMGVYADRKVAEVAVKSYLDSFAEFERSTFMYHIIDPKVLIPTKTSQRDVPEWMHYVHYDFWATSVDISGSEYQFYISTHEVES